MQEVSCGKTQSVISIRGPERTRRRIVSNALIRGRRPAQQGSAAGRDSTAEGMFAWTIQRSQVPRAFSDVMSRSGSGTHHPDVNKVWMPATASRTDSPVARAGVLHPEQALSLSEGALGGIVPADEAEGGLGLGGAESGDLDEKG
ncbi:hypothetical protein VTN02DRAFT_2626 [Thermoascus thermophilus]